MRVFAEQVAKDLLSLRVVAFAQGTIAFAVSLLVSLRHRDVGRAGKGQTKHEGGHTDGRHPSKTLLVITLHDSHLLGHRYFKTSPVFIDQRTRSSSSKSTRTSRAKRISCCSTSRYFLRVEGG